MRRPPVYTRRSSLLSCSRAPPSSATRAFIQSARPFPPTFLRSGSYVAHFSIKLAIFLAQNHHHRKNRHFGGSCLSAKKIRPNWNGARQGSGLGISMYAGSVDGPVVEFPFTALCSSVRDALRSSAKPINTMSSAKRFRSRYVVSMGAFPLR